MHRPPTSATISKRTLVSHRPWTSEILLGSVATAFVTAVACSAPSTQKAGNETTTTTGIPVDTDGDGIVDGVDTDGDGTADIVGTPIDIDGDGVIDGIDTDGDGTIDVEIQTPNGDGDLSGDGDGGPPAGDGDLVGDGDGGGGLTIDDTDIVPLFGATTDMERPVFEDTGSAFVTRFGDRGRDRHARENMFKAYDHYLDHYWVHRTISAEIIDTVPYGGDTITFNVTTEYKLSDNEAELRFFYRGIGTVAEYHNNGVMTPIDDLHYTRSVSYNPTTGGPLQVGDHMEFELSQFLDASVEDIGEPGAIAGYRGRANYYGTTYLYIVGEGLVPWQADNGEDENRNAPFDNEFSYPIPEEGWLGGLTTLPYQYTDEPRDHFMQMATNLAGDNAQPFVLGRRVVHTDFDDGHHTERRYPEEPTGVIAVDNPLWTEQIGKLGPGYINNSCDDCHEQNTRALPPAVGGTLEKWVFKVGDAEGNPLPDLGSVFQTGNDFGAAEGNVTLAAWTEENGLRRPNYNFSGASPTYYSARIAPQLVGLGLLEAIPEADIIEQSDPNDNNGDGVSGRVHTVIDPVTGQTRLGRFGYKAGQATVKHQSAAALNTDMGVMTSIFASPDCGTSQSGCEASGAELDDTNLDHLAVYISLLGVRAQRDVEQAEVVEGKALFAEVGCTSCHTATFQTSPYARHAELRNQTIHPYTDLLLHDMGEGLADNLPEGQASGAEWRTPPLWGIGLTADVNAGEAYLHDGRARTLDEAIRWHGGEGEGALANYESLSTQERAALIAFLKSL